MLAVLLAVALALRLAPLLRYAVWGSDTGEYFAISRHIAQTGAPPTDYQGWGIAYPDFPGMEILVAQVHQVTGLDLLAVLQFLIPALNVLVVLAAYLLGRDLFDRRTGLWAGGIVAVAMPVVFTGSHPMPESLAHGLALVVVWLGLDAKDPRRFAAALGLGLAVIVTHHLTTYFLLLALGALWLARVARERTSAWPRLGLLVGLAVATAAYWLLVAETFRARILAEALPIRLAVGAAAAGLAGLVALAWLRPRLDRTLSLDAVPRDRSTRLGLGMVGGAMVVVGGFTVFGIPGVAFRLDPATVPWYLPMLLVPAFAPLGARRARDVDDGLALYLWCGLIAASLIAGTVVAPTVLIPYRHIPFLAVPAAVLIGAGIDDWLPDEASWKRVVPVAGVVLLAATAYPPPEAIGGFNEGVTDDEMAAVRWADRNLPEDGVVLADHRLSSMLFGFAGMRPSWDSGEAAWYADSFEAAEPILRNLSTPTGIHRVDYVVISPVTRDGVALEQWERAEPLTGAALQKFREPPFVPVYEHDGVRILRIDWDAVEG